MLRRRLPRREPCVHRCQRFLLDSKDRCVDGARGRYEVRAVESVSNCNVLLRRALSHVEVGGDRRVAPWVAYICAVSGQSSRLD